MQMERQRLVALLVVMLKATIGSSNADSCTASLPAVVIRGEDECPALRGGKIMDEIRQNISALLQEVVCYKTCRANTKQSLRKLLDSQLYRFTCPSVL